MRSLYWLFRLSAPTFEPRLTVTSTRETTDEEVLRPIVPGAFAAWARGPVAPDHAPPDLIAGLRRVGAPSPLAGRPRP
jgi:hypothetical protein